MFVLLLQAGEWRDGLDTLRERLQLPVRIAFSSSNLPHPFGYERVKIVTVQVPEFCILCVISSHVCACAACVHLCECESGTRLKLR